MTLATDDVPGTPNVPRSDSVGCPLCWHPNPADRRNCVACHARLRPGPGPKHRRQPRSLAVPTSNAARVITGFFIVAGIFLGGLVIYSLPSADPSQPASIVREEVTETTSSAANRNQVAPPGEPAGPRRLVPSRIVVTSALGPDFGGENLIDGSLSTVWRDADLHGDGAAITLTFDQAIVATGLIITPLTDDTAYHVSYRLRHLRIDTGGTQPFLEVEVPDVAAPYRVDLGGLETRQIVLEVVDTYAAVAHGDVPAAEQLAIAEIEILGRPLP